MSAGHARAAGGVPEVGRGSWMSRHRPGQWRVRTKLGVVVTVPALVVLVLAGLRANTQVQQLQSLTTALNGLRVGIAALRVCDAVQAERDGMVTFVATGRGDTALVGDRLERTDVAVQALRESMADADLAPAVAATAQRVLNEVAGVPTLRTTIRVTRYPSVAALSRYTQILDSLSSLSRETTGAMSSLPVGKHAQAVQALADMQQHMTFQNTLMREAAVSGTLSPESAAALQAARSRFDAARSIFVTSASTELRQRLEDTVTGAEVDGRNRLVDRALISSATAFDLGVSPDDVARVGNAAAELVQAVRTQVESEVNGDVETLAEDAREALVRDQALVLAGLLVAVVVMLWMTRLLISPLRTLRRAALAVAERGLPDAVRAILAGSGSGSDIAVVGVDPVPVHTGEEIGQVARAFDAVHGQAVVLATGQAALRRDMNAVIVNLARRSQVLVESQIGVLDGLEQNEEDPDRLAELFELDHLATRMRRNNDNLLVLSGTRLSTLTTKPVQLAEVVGAAVSEVESYTRVKVGAMPQVAVYPHVVRDLVHLLAELLDNALGFSQPTTEVTVAARRGRDGLVVLQIRDRGIGIAGEELAGINDKLATPPQVDVAVSQRMGLFVVAALADRHDIRVRLTTHDDVESGTSARVELSRALLESVLSDRAVIDQTRLASSHEGRSVQPGVASSVKQPVPSQVDLFSPTGAVATPSPSAFSSQRGTLTVPAGSSDDFPGIVTEDELQVTDSLYEDVLSKWFDTATDGPVDVTNAMTSLSSGAGPNVTQPRDQGSSPDRITPAQPAPLRGNQTYGWGPDEAGWARARAVAGADPAQAETLVGGLPKRRPSTNLIPGSITPVENPPAVGSVVVRRRRAAAPRRAGGLAGFQSGVERGRHALNTTPTPSATTPDTAQEPT